MIGRPRRDATTAPAQVRVRDLSAKVLWPLWIALAALAYREAVYFHSVHQIGADAHAYWLATRHAHPYHAGPTHQDAYLYAPVFRQVLWPLGQLPWHWFYGIWATVEALTFAWLLKPLGWGWGVPAFLLCSLEIIGGNIMAFVALAALIGMRRPEAWAFPLLTKVTVGLGPVWFAARGQWLHVARAIGATVLIAAISFAFDPQQWRDWVTFLVNHRGADAYLLYRVAAAVVLVVIAARRRTLWLLAPAMVLASPVIMGIARYLTLLTAIPRLRIEQQRSLTDSPTEG